MDTTFEYRLGDRVHFSDVAIESLVRNFYAEARADPLIGPVFERRVTEWEPHLLRMMAFWTTVLRGEQVYFASEKGAPPVIHRAIEELTPSHFERWLSLFDRVAHSVFEDGPAAFAVDRATRIGGGLSAHLVRGKPARLAGGAE